MRKAIRLTADIVASDGAPVVLSGAIGIYSEDETSVVFPTALLDPASGPPVFEATFIDSLASKTEPADPVDIPEFDFSSSIPIRGWGLS